MRVNFSDGIIFLVVSFLGSPACLFCRLNVGMEAKWAVKAVLVSLAALGPNIAWTVRCSEFPPSGGSPFCKQIITAQRRKPG